MADKQRFFVSHSYRDKAGLQALREAVPADVDLDIFEREAIDPKRPVSGAIVNRIRQCDGLAYLRSGESDYSPWVTFERDYAARSGLTVYSFDPLIDELREERVDPVELRIVVIASPESVPRANHLLRWMAEERNFRLTNLGIAEREKEAAFQYLEILESRWVALWLLDWEIAAWIDYLCEDYTHELLKEQFDHPRLPPAVPYLLARIAPDWKLPSERDLGRQPFVGRLFLEQRSLDLTSSATPDRFNWARVDDLIVRLTQITLSWTQWLEEHPKYQDDPYWVEADPEEEIEGAEAISWEWEYPYFCRPD